MQTPGNSTSAPAQARALGNIFTALPQELVSSICVHLPNRAVADLACSSKFFHAWAEPWRVYRDQIRIIAQASEVPASRYMCRIQPVVDSYQRSKVRMESMHRGEVLLKLADMASSAPRSMRMAATAAVLPCLRGTHHSLLVPVLLELFAGLHWLDLEGGVIQGLQEELYATIPEQYRLELEILVRIGQLKILLNSWELSPEDERASALLKALSGLIQTLEQEDRRWTVRSLEYHLDAKVLAHPRVLGILLALLPDLSPRGQRKALGRWEPLWRLAPKPVEHFLSILQASVILSPVDRVGILRRLAKRIIEIEPRESRLACFIPLAAQAAKLDPAHQGMLIGDLLPFFASCGARGEVFQDKEAGPVCEALLRQYRKLAAEDLPSSTLANMLRMIFDRAPDEITKDVLRLILKATALCEHKVQMKLIGLLMSKFKRADESCRKIMSRFIIRQALADARQGQSQRIFNLILDPPKLRALRSEHLKEFLLLAAKHCAQLPCRKLAVILPKIATGACRLGSKARAEVVDTLFRLLGGVPRDERRSLSRLIDQALKAG